MKKKNGIVTVSLNDLPPLTAQQKARLRALKDRPIDLSDIPEITEEQWENAVLMPPMTQFKSAKESQAYYRKQLKANKTKTMSMALELEPAVYRWLKAQGKNAHSRVNALVKDYVRMLEKHNQ